MKKNLFLLPALTLFFSCAAFAQTTRTLTPLGSFGFNGDGSIRPGDQTWVDATDMNQRGISYDPLTGRLVYVNTHSGSAGSAAVQGTIEILDSATGAEITTLNTNGISGGSYADFAVGVADDGAVYICNHVVDSVAAPFKIYRWSGVSSVDPPALVFNGTLSPAQRYGSSMDIRGAGTNTQIIIGSMPGGSATNVVIFTTTDGTNFSARVLATDATTANFNDGIAFGEGNTFWAKRIGAPLRRMSFNLATSNAVTLASYTSANLANVQNLGPISVDVTNKLLAAIELVGGTVTSAAERVWLYDISNTNVPPALLGFRDFTPNNPNATAPLGFIDFGVDRVYAAVTRNGILASSIDSAPLPTPIFTKDLLPTNRVAIGQTAHFDVQAYPNITSYQWRVNGNPIPGQTNYFLDVTNVQSSDNGKIYSVLVGNAAGTNASANSVLQTVNPADLFHLNLLWRASPGVSPGPTNWYTGTGGGTPTERTFAYSSFSNQLYVVFRSGTAVRISVIDPATGFLLYSLKTNGIVQGANIPLCAIAVGGDGAIYACNSVLAADVANFRVYRWENSDSNTVPALIFQGNPAPDVTSASFRWGDVMDARGSGFNTELVFDAQNDTRYIGILQPGASLTTNWTAKGYLLQNIPEGPGGGAGGTGIGRSLQFGVGDTFWQKRFAPAGAPLAQSSYDRNLPGTVAPLVLSSLVPPLSTNGSIGIEFSLKLGGALNFAAAGAASTLPDTLDLYDLTAPSTPVLLNRYNFPINAAANNNRIGQVIFTPNNVFALDANNGVMAFTVASGPIPPPTFLTQPKSRRIIEGGSATLTVVVDQIATVQFLKDNVVIGSGSSYTISNAQPSSAGNYFAIASNMNGVATSEVAVVTFSFTNQNYSLSPLWNTPPGLTLGANYVTSFGGNNTPNERSFAYNALSNQLLIVQCPVGGGITPTIHVVDASAGTKLYNLLTDGFIATVSEVSGANPINMLAIAVADDGAIYVGNATPNASGGSDGAQAKKFRIYRWANSGASTPLTLVFEGDPSGQPLGVNLRWGDSLAVRGSGLSTELLLDSNEGGFGAVLTPVDGSFAAFTNNSFSSLGQSGSIGRSLQFGQTNTVYQKRKGGNLFLSNYNLANHSSFQVTNVDFASPTLGGVAVDAARKLVAGVDFVGSPTTPDAVALYDVSDFAVPLLIARYNFPTNQPGNANFIAQTLIAGNKVFSLDGNAGFVAFNIAPPASATLTLSYSVSGSTLTLSWTDTSAILQSTLSLTTPITWIDISTAGQTNSAQSTISGNKFYRLKK